MSCATSAALRPGGSWRLKATVTGTGPGPSLTVARTMRGPMANGGCGRVATKS